MENLDYAAFAIRIIRAHGRRIAQGDIEALPDLLDLAEQLAAVGEPRSYDSWLRVALVVVAVTHRRLGPRPRRPSQRGRPPLGVARGWHESGNLAGGGSVDDRLAEP